HVVELARQYLQERKVAAERVFVVSAHEYDDAKHQGRAPAGWNEMEALRSTLEAHAESHMARLDRLARAAKEQAATAPAQESQQSKPGFFSRLFGKGR
ncbi:MAG TPA: hypothetical protein VFN49_09790, partial [Candidatus Aquilonibacter sp.]|nr:hypothetical protein [Candidatus Aquilonibacter sp.]